MGKGPQPTRADHVKMLIPLLEEHKEKLQNYMFKNKVKHSIQQSVK